MYLLGMRFEKQSHLATSRYRCILGPFGLPAPHHTSTHTIVVHYNSQNRRGDTVLCLKASTILLATPRLSFSPPSRHNTSGLAVSGHGGAGWYNHNVHGAPALVHMPAKNPVLLADPFTRRQCVCCAWHTVSLPHTTTYQDSTKRQS